MAELCTCAGDTVGLSVLNIIAKQERGFFQTLMQCENDARCLVNNRIRAEAFDGSEE